MKKNNFENIFIALIIYRKSSSYEMYLVNQTDRNYSRVVGLTSASSSSDNDFMETGKAMKEIGNLPPYSFVFLEGTDLEELDFVILYKFDLYREQNKERPEMACLGLFAKYLWMDEKGMIDLPILNTKGFRIEINKADRSETIEQMVKHIDMKPKYYKFEQ